MTFTLNILSVDGEFLNKITRDNLNYRLLLLKTV